MLEETVSIAGRDGDLINAYFVRPLGVDLFLARFSFITYPVGMNSIKKLHRSSLIIVRLSSVLISITARGLKSTPQAASRMAKLSAISKEQCDTYVRFRISMAK